MNFFAIFFLTEKILSWILQTTEREVTYKIMKDSLCFELENGASVELSCCYLPVINLLEKQVQDLPPLYSSLELGRNKREFVCNLATIFY